MSDEQDDTGEIEETSETVVENVTETTTTLIDVDGDGVVDIVQETTTTLIDVDGDGVADIIQTETVTGVDVDGDGEFSDDEIEVEGEVAVREDLIDEAEPAEAEPAE